MPSYPVGFLLAVERTLWWETGGRKDGALTNDPDDPGGVTKWGISQKHNPDVDVPKLTKAKAVALYFARYWKPFVLGDLDDAMVQCAAFDLMVNPGPKSGAKVLQQACVILGQPLIIDSKLGPKTRLALNVLSIGPTSDLLANIAGLRYFHYRDQMLARPEAAKFMKGWARRAFQDMALVATDGEQIHRYQMGGKS